jgi:flagellar hook-associated protein 1 FlgK
LNVFIGTGQSLVIGGRASSLTTTPLAEDTQKLDIALVTTGTTISVSDFISGGTLGGLKEFTDRVLDPSKNTLGLIAIGMASAFNDQHRMGMDLDGATGQDFFVVPSVEVTADSGNVGAGPVNVTFDDVSQLTADEYELSFNGAWSLTRSSDGQVVPFASGTGAPADPFLVNGLSIETDPAAVAGDRYVINPTRNGAGQIDMALTENRQIAAAGIHFADAAAGNAGNATISPAQVLNPSDPALLNPVSIVFDAAAANYSVNGGAPIAYTSGADIDVNGFRVQISGVPQPGDGFTVNPNFGGVGDNGNALQLADMQQSLTLLGGTASFNDSYSALVADVATRTRQAEIGSAAQEHLLEQSHIARETVSGVNLDEEAADLLRFEQAYQAAAQVIAVADSLFDELLNAVRG